MSLLAIDHTLPFKMETARSIIDLVTTAAVNGTLPEQLRVILLEAATKLVAALQKPDDAITKLAYQVLQSHSCDCCMH